MVIILYYRTPHFPRKLVHCQINANGPARCGLTNPQHRRKSGLDSHIQVALNPACSVSESRLPAHGLSESRLSRFIGDLSGGGFIGVSDSRNGAEP